MRPPQGDRAVVVLAAAEPDRPVVAPVQGDILAPAEPMRLDVGGAGDVGEALWKLPTKSFRVQTILSDREKQMFNTDQRMSNLTKTL